MLRPSSIDWAAAVATAYLTWQLMSRRLFLAVVPGKIVGAADEVDVLLMEDRGPL